MTSDDARPIAYLPLAAGVCLAAGVAWWWAGTSGEPTTDDASLERPADWQDASAANQPAPRTGDEPWVAGESAPGNRTGGARENNRRADPRNGGSKSGTESAHRSDENPSTAERPGQPPAAGSNAKRNPSAATDSDAGADESSGKEARRSADQMLGPTRWMAKVPKDEAESIQRELDREIDPPYDVSIKDRRALTNQVERAAQTCWRQHLQGTGIPGGQMVVEFEMVAQDGTARAKDPTLDSVVDVEDPDFLDCVRGSVSSLQVASERDGTMAVQYPVFFGDRSLTRDR